MASLLEVLPPHLKIQITGGTEADGHGGILHEHAIDCDALAITGAYIHRRGIFDTLKDRNIASAADRESTGSGRTRRRGKWSDEANRDRVISLEEMGVVVLNAYNFSLLDVVSFLAQEATTGGPLSCG